MGKKKSFLDKKKATTYQLVLNDAEDGEDAPRIGLQAIKQGGKWITDDGEAAHLDPLAGAGEDYDEVDEWIQGNIHPSERAAVRPARPGGAAASFPWHLFTDGPSGAEEHGPAWGARRKEIMELGLPDDGYDYLKHLRAPAPAPPTAALPATASAAAADGRIVVGEQRKPKGEKAAPAVGGGGPTIFLPALEPAQDVAPDAREFDARALVLGQAATDEAAAEGRSNAVSAAARPVEELRARERRMREELDAVMAALEEGGSDAGDELEDDFVLLSTQGPASGAAETEDEDEEGSEGAESEGGAEGEVGRSEAGSDVAAMNAQFDRVAMEYDDEDIGSLEDEEGEIRGRAPAARFADVFDEFIETHAGAKARERGTAYAAPADGGGDGGFVACAAFDGAREGYVFRAGPQGPGYYRDDAGGESGEEWLDEEAAVARAALARTKALAEKFQYGVQAVESDQERAAREAREARELRRMMEKPRERWDCESMASMRSNALHHPGRIGAPPKPASRAGADGAAPAPVKLSAQGVPVGYVRRAPARGEEAGSEDGGEDEHPAPPNSAAPKARTKGESAEERRARKQAVKDQKRARREEKKRSTAVFKGVMQQAQRQQAGMGQASSVIKL
ncbi:unnamed protein product [Pedinophyceae sp. YPF-701]|nr:unnamed protein product [Pedinophyceae sp. YPF-701]